LPAASATARLPELIEPVRPVYKIDPKPVNACSRAGRDLTEAELMAMPDSANEREAVRRPFGAPAH
jgi:hypothetical protein